jgi:hypothetical protein
VTNLHNADVQIQLLLRRRGAGYHTLANVSACNKAAYMPAVLTHIHQQ